MEKYAIIGFIITIILLIIFWLVIQYNKFNWQKVKLQKGEINLLSLFEKKYQILCRIITFLKENTTNEIKDLNYNFEQKDLYLLNKNLEKENNIINSYLDENEKIIKNTSFKKINQELIDINIAINGSKKYYNDNLTLYNHLCHAFPSKIIALLFKYKEKNFLDEELTYELKILKEKK